MNEWKNAQFSPSRSPSSRRAYLSSSVRPIESRRARCDNALAVLPRTTRRERRARSSRSIVAHSRPVAVRRRLVEPPPTDRPTDVHTCIRSYVHTYIPLCRVLYGGHVRRQQATRCWRDVARASRAVPSRIGQGIRAIHVAWGRGVYRARDVHDATPTPRASHHRSVRTRAVDAAVVRAGCARVRWRRRSRARRR